MSTLYIVISVLIILLVLEIILMFVEAIRHNKRISK